MFNSSEIVEQILLGWGGFLVKTLSDQEGELSRSQ